MSFPSVPEFPQFGYGTTWRFSSTGQDYMLLISSSNTSTTLDPWLTGGSGFQELIQHSVTWLDLGPVDAVALMQPISLQPLHPLMPIVSAYDPNLIQRIFDKMNGWDKGHERALGVSGCLTAPPGAMQEIQAAHDIVFGTPNAPPSNGDSEQGGAGGNSVWMPNINTQRNGGQSTWGSTNGAATANAVGLGSDYVGSALPCAVRQ